MKTLKYFLGILVIFVALILTGLETSNAQSYPNLTFDWYPPDQDCDCSMAGTAYWHIDVAIVNECGEEFFLEWEDYATVSASTYSQQFFPDWSCDDPSNDKCYLVTGEVKKLCPDGHGGFIDQCSGKFNALKSCYELMHSGWTLFVQWD